MRRQEITLKDVYEVVGDARTELLGEIKSLRQDFLEMEKGRLTRLENQFAEFRGENKTRITMTAGIVSVVITIGLFLINQLWR